MAYLYSYCINSLQNAFFNSHEVKFKRSSLGYLLREYAITDAFTLVSHGFIHSVESFKKADSLSLALPCLKYFLWQGKIDKVT